MKAENLETIISQITQEIYKVNSDPFKLTTWEDICTFNRIDSKDVLPYFNPKIHYNFCCIHLNTSPLISSPSFIENSWTLVTLL